MKEIEINIQLDPVEDGAIVIPKQVVREDKGALIIGTNGEYRFAKEAEVYEILDRLGMNCAADYMGMTDYMTVFNSKKVLNTGGSQFVVGSVMIVKGTERGIELLNEVEVEEAKIEFESRLAVLCGGGIQFSAYEIG